ncbi:hypothetical protein M514_01531 [Trichuris suis]|uniref:Peptidase S1 domain-containing protein n=1 Tax=Trichuris suis TaxID=68888 RepID=A0A085NAN8_9BILA|nr:hypothetical protein M514_01531 [Trichuris suis]
MIILLLTVVALFVRTSEQGPRPDPYPCGVPHFQPVYGPNRISGGWEVARHSFPWHVHIMVFDANSKTKGGQCGGSLIRIGSGNATDLVLTAAHCIVELDKRTGRMIMKRIENIVVTVAVHMRNDPERTRVRVRDLRDGGYEREFGPRDIAVLRLEKKIPYTKFTRPVCLPEKVDRLPVGEECYVAGHGNLFMQSHSSPEELRMVRVAVWSKEDCKASVDPGKELDYETQFCAGTGDAGSQKGDSGGALVCKIRGRFIQYGIVSFGSEDLIALDKASKYTFVPKYIDWIESANKVMDPTHEVMPEEDVHEYLTIKERNQRNLNRSKSAGSLIGGRTATPPPQRQEYKCGSPAQHFPIKMSAKGGFNRISGGWEANKHSLPWTVLITNTDLKNPADGNLCGGALIQIKPANRSDLVLTAAHCLHDKLNRQRPTQNCKVFVGIHHQFSDDALAKEVKAKQFLIHPEYKSEGNGGRRNDIALIKLQQYVPYTDITMPVCLPDQAEKILPGHECIVAGWGQTSHYSPAYQSELLMAVVKIVPFEECKKETNFIVESEVLCTKGENRGGFCHVGIGPINAIFGFLTVLLRLQGDSGGPLVCKDERDSLWKAYGIVSFSSNRCSFTFDKYTKVASYRKWIHQEGQKMQPADSELPYERLVEYLTPNEVMSGAVKRHTVGAIQQSGGPSSSLPSRPSPSASTRPATGSSPTTPGAQLPSRPGRHGKPSSSKGQSKERARVPARGASGLGYGLLGTKGSGPAPTQQKSRVYSRFGNF